MPRPSSWRTALALVIILLLAAQGLVNALRPVLPWIVGGLGILVVLGLVVLAVIHRGTRW